VENTDPKYLKSKPISDIFILFLRDYLYIKHILAYALTLLRIHGSKWDELGDHSSGSLVRPKGFVYSQFHFGNRRIKTAELNGFVFQFVHRDRDTFGAACIGAGI